MKKTPPREVPSREEKYMGLAWVYASFSKDPITQVGACIISEYNVLLGCGYNGPPRLMDDESISWDRPPKDDPDAFSKYDIMIHAEINAMDHSCGDLADSTLYVTAFPCSKCMLEIVRKEIGKVVYYDFKSGRKSSLQNTKDREKSLKIAEMANIKVEEFQGNINWVPDWAERLRELGIFE